MIPLNILMAATGARLNSGSLPPLVDDNATFNDEGESTSGWTATNATLSVTGSTLRCTKTSGAGTGANAKRAITMPGDDKDYILFGRIRASTASGCVVWLENSGASRLEGVWLNSTDLGVYQAGRISMTGFNGGARTGSTLATGVNTSSTTTDFAMQFDAKFSTLSVFFREIDGRWNLKGRVACTYNTPLSIAVLHLSTNAPGAWIEFDFLTICRPNIMVIGDSIAEGKTLYSPNLSLGLSDYSSHWSRYARIYLDLRNNLMINKGVGSQTSAQILARIAADITDQQPRVVFLHASSNDYVQGLSESARTTNITNTITSIKAAGAECVLLNAMYGTSTNTSNPAQRDYADAWWDAHSASVGAHTVIDIMLPIEAAGYMNSALTQSDNIHPTPAGYQVIGEYIAQA